MALPHDREEARERAIQYLRQAQANVHATEVELGEYGLHANAPDELVALPAVRYDIDILIRSLQRRWNTDEEGYFERLNDLHERSKTLRNVTHDGGLDADAIGMTVLPPGSGRDLLAPEREEGTEADQGKDDEESHDSD